MISAALAVAVAAMAFGDKGTSGQSVAQASHVTVGTQVAPADYHPLDRPGLYGLSAPLPGSRYAIVGSSVVRVDLATDVVLSIVRPVPPQP